MPSPGDRHWPTPPSGSRGGGGSTTLSLREQAILQRTPKKQPNNIVGKAWNSGNSALGLMAGGAGYVVGQFRGKDQPRPRVQTGHNAVEFLNNPTAPKGGLTLGNVVLYGDDPYLPGAWKEYREKYGHPIQQHEEQHTYQGEQLGPFYLPSHIAGGMTALVRDGRWGGPANWNERGPKMNPPRPSPGKR